MVHVMVTVMVEAGNGRRAAAVLVLVMAMVHAHFPGPCFALPWCIYVPAALDLSRSCGALDRVSLALDLSRSICGALDRAHA